MVRPGRRSRLARQAKTGRGFVVVGEPDIVLLDSLDQLRGHAEAWNALWQRTPAASPLSRAELVAHWVAKFAPQGRFRAVIVRQDARWLAALPLVERSRLGLARWGARPVNAWSEGGSLLLDPDSPLEPLLDRLVRALRLVPWRVLSWDEIPLDSHPWAHFQQALLRAGYPLEILPRFTSGRVLAQPAWTDYWSDRTKKHRHNMRRNWNRLQQLGAARADYFSRVDDEQLEPLLRQGFEIENRSWKGTQSTSVLQAPGMFEFFLGQARLLNQLGMLRLAFLLLDRQPIAFDYGLAAGNCFHRIKIGYDPAYAGYSPGQLLCFQEVLRLHQRGEEKCIDFLGPLSPALAAWTNQAYTVGRLVCARPGVAGRSALQAYLWARRWRARCLGAGQASRGPRNRVPGGPPVDQSSGGATPSSTCPRRDLAETS